MADLRVVYAIPRLEYGGHSVGRDWTIRVHTGAGLVELRSDVRSGARAVIGAIATRDIEAGTVPGVERWWVSAVERDEKQDDVGVSEVLSTVVRHELGHVMTAVLRVDVTELGVRRVRVGSLEVTLTAEITRADAPAPTLNPTVAAAPLSSEVPRPEGAHTTTERYELVLPSGHSLVLGADFEVDRVKALLAELEPR